MCICSVCVCVCVCSLMILSFVPFPQDGPSLVKKVRGSYLFKVTGSDGTVVEWLVDLKNGSGSVTKSPGDYDAIVNVYLSLT